MTTTTIFAEIFKQEKQADGSLKVWGKATGPELDSDLQICDPVWLSKAMPSWFQFGNIREMHGHTAAGVATELDQDGDAWTVGALIVDPGSVAKVDSKVLKGFSIGIRGARVIKDVAAPGGRIVGGDIVELSLVDRPANPTCMLALAKMEGDELVKADVPPIEGNISTETDPEEAAEADLLASAVQAIKDLLVGEVGELAAGEGGLGPVNILTYILSELEWFAECDAYDDAAARIESMKTATTEEPMNLATIATLTKAACADDAPDEDKAAVADLVKALGIEAMIATATAEAVSTQDLEQVVERIAKVEAAASNNGPVRVPALVDSTDAHRAELVVKAAGYRQQAAQMFDQKQAEAYRKLAEGIDLQISAL